MTRIIAPVALVLATAVAFAAQVKSGLDIGESAAAFNVKDITGPNAGKSLCYRCKYSAQPTAVIFTREINADVAKLIKALDTTVASNSDKKMAGFVVLLTDNADAGAKELTKVAAEQGIKNIPLTVYDGVAGPEKYKISKDAAVTVMMWKKTKVQANHAFATPKIGDDQIKAITADSSKILN